MKPDEARERFLHLIEATGNALDSLDPATGIKLMLDFYRDERAEDCNLDEDGDMLLFQWGCYDWGKGESFEFNITRQFMGETGEDDEIQQLMLTFKFEPVELFRQTQNGNQWCSSPEELDEFKSFIHSSAAFQAVAKAKHIQVTLEIEAQN